MSRVALVPGHAREYETVYVLRPNLDREKADKVASRIVDALASHEGLLTEAELWGQRRLAYPIKKHHRGIYVYLKYLGRGGTVAEIERQLRLDDSVIRYQTVLLKNDVVLDGGEAAASLDIDFEVPHEPDTPELPIERELGLDYTGGGRDGGPRRRDRRDEDDLGDEDDDDMGDDRDDAEG